MLRRAGCKRGIERRGPDHEKAKLFWSELWSQELKDNKNTVSGLQDLKEDRILTIKNIQLSTSTK